MMIFLGLILITTTVIALFKGTLFKGILERIKELAADYRDNYYDRSEAEYAKAMVLNMMPVILGGSSLLLIQLIFLVNIVSVPFVSIQIATIAMMSLIIFSFLKSINKASNKKREIKSATVLEKVILQKQAADDLANLKTRTLQGTIINTISLVYYIAAVAVLLILL